jgi:hypothetical protein
MLIISIQSGNFKTELRSPILGFWSNQPHFTNQGYWVMLCNIGITPTNYFSQILINFSCGHKQKHLVCTKSIKYQTLAHPQCPCTLSTLTHTTATLCHWSPNQGHGHAKPKWPPLVHHCSSPCQTCYPCLPPFPCSPDRDRASPGRRRGVNRRDQTVPMPCIQCTATPMRTLEHGHAPSPPTTLCTLLCP